jgi:hypothetical protein
MRLSYTEYKGKIMKAATVQELMAQLRRWHITI